jgi:uncharacterized protein YidB (DUF937 family)
MSWFQGIIGGAIGAEALNLIKNYVEKNGGVEGVVKQLENTEIGEKVRSWVSTDPNKPITVEELQKAVDIEKITEMAKSAGLPVDKAKELLAEYLPVIIDKFTPDGKLPPNSKS